MRFNGEYISSYKPYGNCEAVYASAEVSLINTQTNKKITWINPEDESDMITKLRSLIPVRHADTPSTADIEDKIDKILKLVEELVRRRSRWFPSLT